MATRPGDVDPGLLLHMLQKGIDARRLEHTVNHAIDLYCYRIVKYVAFALQCDEAGGAAATGHGMFSIPS
jgi:acetate kinase